VAFGEEEFDSVGEEDALLHWETLLVVSACDAGDVTLPFVAKGIERDFLRESLIVEVSAAMKCGG
jgi:hypothetical protein